MKKVNTEINALLSSYAFDVNDFKAVCRLLNVCDYTALYFIRRGIMYRAFLPIDDVPDEWMRYSVSSKNAFDVRLKLYIPAPDADALIENDAENMGPVDEFFKNYSPVDEFGKKVNKGHYIENMEVNAMIHDAVSTGILPMGTETYINRPANTHLSTFEGADYIIETYADDDETARMYNVSVKGPDATVYSLDSLALYYRKNPEKINRICGMNWIESGRKILQAIETYINQTCTD